MNPLLFLSIFALPFVSQAQERRSFDTAFLNSSSSVFFERNTTIARIECQVSSGHSRYVSVFPKSKLYNSSYELSQTKNFKSFNFNFLGDRYLFERSFGPIQFPQIEMDTLLGKTGMIDPLLELVMDRDSIKCRLKYFAKADILAGDYFFIKVERPTGYRQGITALQQVLEQSFKSDFLCSNAAPQDSVFIFKLLIDKSGCLLKTELTDGNNSAFVQFIKDKLGNHCSWLPMEQGGRPVLHYLPLFVAINQDNSLIVATPE